MDGEDDRADRAAGALLGTLLGDALGAPDEGAPPSRPDASGPGSDWIGGTDRLDRSVAAGARRFTDDTQMAIALALHLLEHPDVQHAELGRRFVEHRERWRGYGAGTQRVLDALERGDPPDRAARTGFAEGSLGNGAGMRAAPVGVRWCGDLGRCAEVARRSALPTHVHDEGADGAVAVAVAVAAAMSGGDPLAAATGAVRTERMRSALREAGALGAAAAVGDVVARLGNDATAVGSVPTALWITRHATGVEDVLVRALAVGGDTDTIAAMALAVAAAREGARALPAAWVRAVNEPTWTPHAVADLGRRLAAA